MLKQKHATVNSVAKIIILECNNFFSFNHLPCLSIPHIPRTSWPNWKFQIQTHRNQNYQTHPQFHASGPAKFFGTMKDIINNTKQLLGK